MCRKVNCDTCSKPTWKGCGMHIDSALSGLAEGDRCAGWKQGKCPAAPAATGGAGAGGGCSTA
ncbi:unnamed protein product [Pylaiella littoralis]